jgi:hypothetical protein
MQEINKPFRFTWDFCLVWAFLAVPTWFFTRNLDSIEWYSHGVLTILVSLFATFVSYGPILLAKQIKRSGSYGYHVLKVLLLIFFVVAILFVILLVSGFYTEERARFLVWVVFGSLAGGYLSSKRQSKK